jgi:hypothetical protein
MPFHKLVRDCVISIAYVVSKVPRGLKTDDDNGVGDYASANVSGTFLDGTCKQVL